MDYLASQTLCGYLLEGNHIENKTSFCPSHASVQGTHFKARALLPATSACNSQFSLMLQALIFWSHRQLNLPLLLLCWPTIHTTKINQTRERPVAMVEENPVMADVMLCRFDASLSWWMVLVGSEDFVGMAMEWFEACLVRAQALACGEATYISS